MEMFTTDRVVGTTDRVNVITGRYVRTTDRVRMFATDRVVRTADRLPTK